MLTSIQDRWAVVQSELKARVMLEVLAKRGYNRSSESEFSKIKLRVKISSEY